MAIEAQRDDAVGMAGLVARGDVSAVELVEAAITRIERVNDQLNAVVAKIYDRALDQARRPRPGLFSGVPILLKELMPYPGLPSTMASVAYADAATGPIPVIVERIESAGFIVLGRTNSSEFGALPVTQSDLFGATRNPWSPAHDSGGSSGGAAAAVAAGMLPLAQGGDGGGSIRIPASACGVFGLKVSRGRISSSPGANPDGFGTHHALTRTVRDSAAFLDSVRGSLPGDRWTCPPPEDSYLALMERASGPLRIAVAPNGFMGHGEAHPECVRAVEIAATLCASLGHHVDVAQPLIDHEAVNDAFLGIAAISTARAVADLRTRHGKVPRRMLGTWIWGAARHGAKMRPWASVGMTECLQRAAYQIADFQQRYDVILTPVLHQPPLRIGEIIDECAFLEMRERMLAYCPHTAVLNATGQPAMSVPLHWTSQGLPIGTQFIGRFGEEDVLYRLARQLELAQPWAERWAPINCWADQQSPGASAFI